LNLVSQAAELLRDYAGASSRTLGFGELPSGDLEPARAIEILREEPELCRQEYPRVFGLIACRECPPYETEYLPNEDTFFRMQHLADLAGFYRAFGLEPSREHPDRPDHLAAELEFAALLVQLGREAHSGAAVGADNPRGICLRARRAFLRDHLAWWVPSFTLALRRRADQGLFAECGRILAALLPIERARLDVDPPPVPLEARTSDDHPSTCEGCLN
jgi:TorA maturation chaperone TorD